MDRVLNSKRITLWVAVAIFVIAGVLPLCFMLAASLTSAANYTATLGNPRTWGLLRSSLLLAMFTTTLASLAGVTLGIVLAKTDLPLRSVFAVVLSMPLLFPPYILAVGWYEALGRGGLLSQWAGSAVGEATSAWLFAFPGAVLVLTTAFLPVVLLLTMTYLRAVNPALEQAARLSSRWPAVLGSITIPLAAPGIVLSLVLVFLMTMGEFGAPAFLRVDVFPVASFTQFTAFYNFGAATAAALPLVVVALLGLAVEQRVLREKTFQFGWGLQRDCEQVALGSARTPLFLLITLTSLVLVALPLGALVLRGLSLAVLREALDRAGASAIRTLVYSAVSATALSMLGFFLAYLIHRRAVAFWRSIDAVALFLFTLPGSVIAIGLIAVWNRPSTNWIYATPAILVTGFIAQYAALSTRTILAGFAQTSPSLEEAAEVAGAGWFRRVREILVPLAMPSILVSWAVTFLFCAREVSLALLLAPPGQDTLTARTMTLMANGSPELVAALCLLSMSLTAVPLAVYGAARTLWCKAV